MGISDVHAALLRITAKLAELGIDYAICGGLAVNEHGYRRTTTDIDLLVTPKGHARFKDNAIGLGWIEKFAGSRGVRDSATRVPIDFLLTGGVPGDGTPRGLVFPDPASVTIERAGCRYLELAQLIELKLASGLSVAHRLQDLADVSVLIRVNALGEHFAAQMHPWVQGKYAELWREAQKPDPWQE